MPGKDASPLYPEQPALLRAATLESCSQLSRVGGWEEDTHIAPELHSGLFTLNHSVVSLGQGIGMDAADPMSFPLCGHRPIADAEHYQWQEAYN